MNLNPKNIRDEKRTKIEQALQVLEDAAKDTKNDVVDIFQEKYANTKSTFKDLISDLNLKQVTQEVADQAETIWKDSKTAIRKSAREIDHSVHQNPWIFLGATTLVGLTLGWLLGRKTSSMNSPQT